MASAIVELDLERAVMRETLARYALALQQISGYRVPPHMTPSPEATMAAKALSDPTFGSDPALSS